MEAKDLMIGDYVFPKEDSNNDEYIVVESICDHGINVYPYQSYDTPTIEAHIPFDKDFKGYVVTPIPLTEEWLKKLGFIWNNGVLKKGHFKFMEQQEQYGGGFKLYIHVLNCEHVKHVHQLQNLYKALTGEDLKIKEG